MSPTKATANDPAEDSSADPELEDDSGNRSGTDRESSESENEGAKEPPEKVYSEVLVTSSRSQHPDEGATDKAWFSNYPTGRGGRLAVSAIVHRRSDGTVTVARRKADTGSTFVVMVLGMLEPGSPASRSFTVEEQTAIEELLDDLRENEELPAKAPIAYEHGAAGQGWEPKAAPEPPEASESDEEPSAPDDEPEAADTAPEAADTPPETSSG